MSFKEEKTGGKTIYRGKILNLVVDDVRLPNGSAAKREIVRHAGGAAVLFINDGKVLLVKQFRYAYGKELYEIPAGMINEGEEPVAAAVRELEEETGYRAEMEPLGFIYPSPGYTDEIIHLFFAKNAIYIAQKLDDGEFLNLSFVPLERVREMIENGEISDAKTVAAVYGYLLKKQN